MKRSNNRRILACLAGALAIMTTADVVRSQDRPAPGTPPSWDALTRCADMDGDDDKLACFMDAMRDAGYRQHPAAVAASKRHRFGLDSIVGRRPRPASAAPSPEVAQNAADYHKPARTEPAADDDRVSVTLDLVTIIPTDGRLVVTTTDGAVWEQNDPGRVSPLPKAGEEMVIRRTSLGGYFCKFGRWSTVRCIRRR